MRRKLHFHNRKAELILITGGARSGKSAYAESLARSKTPARVLYLVTAEPLDDEMRARIEKHRAEHLQEWQTLEAPRNLPEAIASLERSPQLIVLDCLTFWVTNEMLASEADLDKRLYRQLDLLMEWTHLNDIDLILVTNEVGWGIAPDNAFSRRFRDALGQMNAYVAQQAEHVYLMVAGLPLDVKHYARPHP